MTITAHIKGHHTTPLCMAVTTDDPAVTIIVAPKFPPELLLAMEDQSTVVSRIGEDTPPTATSIKPLEVIPPSKLDNPRLESFLATLDNAWPTNTLTDAMLRQLQAFVSEVLGFADRALQEFDQMVHEFCQEREDLQKELWELHAD